MKNSRSLFWGTLIMGMAFALVLAGCTTPSGGETPLPPEQEAENAAEQLTADLNAIKAGSAVVDGANVTLSGEVYFTTSLTVPMGVTLDLTTEGARLELRDGAVLTVNGTVNASGHGDHGKGYVQWGLRIAEGTTVINGSGTINLKSKGRLLGIGERRKLTLDGVTLVGLADNDNSLVPVGGDGELVLKNGAITGNSRTDPGDSGGAGMGGGVFVNVGGTFTMEGGTISGNSAIRRGGGVCSGGTFTMKGGVIFGNSSDIGGGVAAVDDTNVFIMEGGRIQGNTDSDGFTKNTATTRGASVQNWPRGKWGTGGTYTQGGVPQTGGSSLTGGSEFTDDTLIAIPAP